MVWKLYIYIYHAFRLIKLSQQIIKVLLFKYSKTYNKKMLAQFACTHFTQHASSEILTTTFPSMYLCYYLSIQSLLVMQSGLDSFSPKLKSQQTSQKEGYKGGELEKYPIRQKISVLLSNRPNTQRKCLLGMSDFVCTLTKCKK